MATAGLVAACAHSTDEIVQDDPDTASGNSGGETAGAGGNAGSAGSTGGTSTRAGTTSNGGKAGSSGASAGGNAGTKPSGGSGGATGGNAGGGSGGSAGKSNGGAGGSAGNVGSGGAVNAGTLELDYKADNVDPADNQIRMGLRVKSTAATPIALSSLELRYYFTSEVALPLVVELYDAAVANGTESYHAVSHDAVKTMVQGASSYLSVTFTGSAGTLAMGDALTLDIALHGQNWTGNFTETNDYSFAPDHTDFAPWDHVTVFGPALVWGKEPP